MEMNKDEAGRCIELARKSLSTRDFARARKFAHKANQLFPSHEAADLIKKIDVLEAAQSKSADASGSTQENGGEPSGVRRRTTAHSPPPASASASSPASGAGGGGEAVSPSRSFTPEQEEKAKKVLRCKTHYERLSVERTATAVEIKKAYRKLALELHPDKNCAPSANDAFKAVSKAFEVLNDETSRRRYDMTGEEDPRPQQHHHHHGGFRHEMTPEELFAQMFGAQFGAGGGGFYFGPGRGQYRRTYHQQHHGQREEEGAAFGNRGGNLWLFLIMFFFMFVLPSFMRPDEPVYSLSRSNEYPVERFIKNYADIRYYLKADAVSIYDESTPTGRSKIRQLEQSVERAWVSHTVDKCNYEHETKRVAVRRAQISGDPSRLNKANAMRTPSCETLQNYYDHRGS